MTGPGPGPRPRPRPRECKIHGCERETVQPEAPLCRECRREYGGYRRRRPPERQLAYMRALCRVHPLTGCWEPMSGKKDEHGYVWMDYAGTRDSGHRIAMRVTDPHLGVSWPYHPWIVLHAPLCEWAYRTGRIAARCWNPEHLRPGSHLENHQHYCIASAAMIAAVHGAPEADIAEALRFHAGEVAGLAAEQEARLGLAPRQGALVEPPLDAA